MFFSESEFILYKEFTADYEEQDYSGDNVGNAFVKLENGCNFTCTPVKKYNKEGGEIMKKLLKLVLNGIKKILLDTQIT